MEIEQLLDYAKERGYEVCEIQLTPGDVLTILDGLDEETKKQRVSELYGVPFRAANQIALICRSYPQVVPLA